MPSDLPQFTIRINKRTLFKIRHIADYNERSANKEITLLIRRHIAAHEAEHGVINVPAELPADDEP